MSRRHLALACLIVLIQLALFLGLRKHAIPENDNPDPDHRPGRDRPAPSADEEQELYQWFDRLGFPNLATCRFVTVATGRTYQRGTEPPQNSYCLGFLLSDQDGEFCIFGLDLQTHNYRKTPQGTPEHQAVRYEEADLASLIGAYVTQLEQQPNPLTQAARYFGACLGECADHFVLARACAAKGQTEFAHRLWLYAQKKHAESGQHKGKAFRQSVSDEIAHALLWRAVVAFGDPSTPRRALLDQLETIAQRYPGSGTAATTEAQRLGWEPGYHAEAIQNYISVLRRMVAEDEEHARQPPRPGKALTTQERVAELIFRLRDQNGRQWSNPGSCQVFLDREGSPAHQLAEIGYEAVPQLIAVLEDDRLTRSLGHHRSFYFSHYVLRVGDCALAVLERIAACSFWQGRSTWASMVKDGQAAETRKKVEAWWAEQQKKGEKQMLIEAVQAGDWQSVEAARRLVQKYSRDALPAITRGTRKVREPNTRHELIRAVTPLRDAAVQTFLREELKGPSLYGRIAAAQGLLLRGSDDGVRPLIVEWHRLLDPASSADRVDELIKFLATCGSAEAVKALGKDLRKRPIMEREGVIYALDPSAGVFFWLGWDRKQPTEAPALQEAINELLVQEFDDRERVLGLSGTAFGRDHSHPRLCDLAGQVVTLRWKLEERYRLDGPEKTCDRQLAELRNLWRHKRGLPPIPLPNAGVIGGKAGVVAAAFWAADSVNPNGDWQRRLEALKGQPLRAKALIDLVLAALRSPPEGVKGIEVVAERERGDSGIVVTVRLLAEKPRRLREDPAQVRKSGAPRQWSVYEAISVDRKGVWCSSSGSVHEFATSEESWRSFGRSVDQALETRMEQSVWIFLSVSED